MYKMNWYKNKIEFSLQYYSKESNITSKPWSGMIQHIFQLAVVMEEILLSYIIQKNQTWLPGEILKPWSLCNGCAIPLLGSGD